MTEAHYQFYRYALDYLVAGRAATLAWCPAIAGNLFHHAVEMLLKGALSKNTPLATLKKAYGHDLPKLWTAFKDLFSTEDLSEFDRMIDELHRFEDIRYPDSIIANGAALRFGFDRVDIDAVMTGPEPKYQFGVGDIDAFFGRLFHLCRMNPKAYLSHLSPHGRELLTKWNEESADWLP